MIVFKFQCLYTVNRGTGNFLFGYKLEFNTLSAVVSAG